MDRRLFLRRAGLATFGLLTGDAVLEAFERLTHVRTLFPSAALPVAWDSGKTLPVFQYITRLTNLKIDKSVGDLLAAREITSMYHRLPAWPV